jgi:Ca2+-binding RTX toxin-like protein
MVLDIAAIQSLYGANMDMEDVSNVYSYDETKPFAETIWDPGFDTAIDKLDLSNFTENLVIDLGPGKSSTVPTSSWQMSDNLTIARDSYIENIETGSGDDVILGNTLDNVIIGGDGDDTIDGLDGADTFVTRVGAGIDIINDFSVGEDKLAVFDTGGIILSYSELTGTEGDSGEMVIRVGTDVVFLLEGHADTSFSAAFVDDTFVIA